MCLAPFHWVLGPCLHQLVSEQGDPWLSVWEELYSVGKDMLMNFRRGASRRRGRAEASRTADLAQGMRERLGRLAAIEAAQRRGVHLEVSDEEGEVTWETQRHEEVVDAAETRFLKAITKIGGTPRSDIPYYNGSLNGEEKAMQLYGGTMYRLKDKEKRKRI